MISRTILHDNQPKIKQLIIYNKYLEKRIWKDEELENPRQWKEEGEEGEEEEEEEEEEEDKDEEEEEDIYC